MVKIDPTRDYLFGEKTFWLKEGYKWDRLEPDLS